VRKFTVILILFCSALAIPAMAQETNAVSAAAKTHSLYDSLQKRSQIRFAADSFRITSWSDTLSSKINTKFSLDSLNYQNKIDSLRGLGLPDNQYTRKLDSLRQRKETLLTEVKSKKESMLSKTRGRMEEWRNKIAEKTGGKLPGDLPGTERLPISIPGSDLAGNLPDINTSLPTDDLNLQELPSMPELKMPELENIGLSPDLSSLNKTVSFEKIDQLGDLQEKLGGATDQLSALKDIQTNPNMAVETAVTKLDEAGALKEQLDGADALKNNEFMETAEKLKDPAAMQEEVKEVVVQKAVNHFAGKEEVLQQAMDKMAKYKQKYESLNSLSDIKKRPPNPMKGKPFIERLVPGVALQVLKNEDLLLDVNPYAGYRITGRLTSGIGWNQRIGYSLDENYFTSAAVIYGPRIFAEFKTWRGFVVRAEGEVMNTFVPARILPRTTDNGGRAWIKSAFVGIKKEYRFLNTVKGTAFVMFRLYDDGNRSPYGDVVNSRFGFEFPLKKKPKKTSQGQE
jgi:hypothetical protein